MKTLLASVFLGALCISACAASAPEDTPVKSAPAVKTSPEPTAAALSDLERDWAQRVSVEAARRDLETLYEGLQQAHYDLFVNRSRQDYDALYEEMRASLGAPVTRLELYLALQRFTEFGNVAHARIDFPSELYAAYRERGGKALPLYPRIERNAVYVGQDLSGRDDIDVGDQILEIDGRPVDAVMAEVMETISGDTPAIEQSLIEFVLPQRLWILDGERASHDLTLRSEDGPVRTLTVRTLTQDEQAANADSGDNEAETPALREARMIEPGIAYLKPGPFYNAEDATAMWDNRAFKAFVDESFESFLEAKAETLILDLRDNPGGDNSFSDPMLSWIADTPFSFAARFLVRSSAQSEASNAARLEASGATEGPSVDFARLYAETPHGEDFDYEIATAYPREDARFEGKVIALIDRNSYSNAVNVASILKDYGWATLIGEPTTDFATTYGAMESFTLPESGFQVGYPKAHIIRPNGDLQAGPVYPDVVVTPEVGETDGDPMLDAAVAYAKS